MSAQSLLGLAGAALLVVAAIVFAAVTWDLVPPPMRVGLLLLWTLAAVGAALALARATRPVTAAAMGLLAVGLAWVTVATARALDVLGFGSVALVGAFCLASLAACGTGVALSSEVRWARGASRVAWVAAMSFGVGWGFDIVNTLARVPEWHVLPPLAVVAAAACLAGRWFLGGPGPLLAIPAALWLFVASAVAPFAVHNAGVWLAVLITVAAAVAAAGWLWLDRLLGATEIGVFLAVSTLTGVAVAWVARVGEGSWVPGLTALVVLAAIVALEPWWVESGASRLSGGQPAREPVEVAAQDAHPPRGRMVVVSALLGSWPATGWAALEALWAGTDGGAALGERFASPWARTMDPFSPDGASVAIVLLAVVVAAVVALAVRRVVGDAVVAGILVLIAVAGPAAWHASLPDVVLWLAALVPAAAAVAVGSGVVPVGLEAWHRRTMLVAGLVAIPIATGWLAHDALGTLLGSAVALAVVAALRVGGVTAAVAQDADEPPQAPAPGPGPDMGAAPGWPGADVVGSSIDLLVAIVGVVAAAAVGASLAGVVDAPPLVVAVLAAVGVALAAEAWLRRPVPSGLAMTVVGVADLVIVMIALGMSHRPAATAAGMVAALGILGAATVDRERPFGIAVAWATGHGVIAALLLRADPGVGVAEAWTSGPAVVLLALGATRLVQDATSRSTVLIPGLAVGLVPLLVAVLGDPGDVWRVVALTVVGAALLTAGSVAKVSTPVLAGTVAVAVVVLTQSLVLVRVLPRIGVFALFAVLGVLLVIASATYERRLDELRRLRGHIAGLR